MRAVGNVTVSESHSGDRTVAASWFRQLHRRWPEYVEDGDTEHACIGGCEACGVAIFDDEDFLSDDSEDVGVIYLHRRCHAAPESVP